MKNTTSCFLLIVSALATTTPVVVSYTRSTTFFSPRRRALSTSSTHRFHGNTSSSHTKSSQTRLFEGNSQGDFDNDDLADFAQQQENQDSTFSSSSSDDPFMSSLRNRLNALQSSSTQLPLMILDTMLPRQILDIQIEHPTLKKLMRHRLRQETPTLGMLGMANVAFSGSMAGSQMVPLRTGVEVEILKMEKAADSKPGEDAWDISLGAGRRFVVEGEVTKTEGGWTEAQVTFLDSSQEEEEELQQFSKPSSGMYDEGGNDRMSLARAISKCKQFTSPNLNMKNGASLVERWIELAKENERHPGQIERLLGQLGDIPPEHEPTERALWVGALINPLPSMGVAMEIRPKLLVSKKAEERVEIALDGMLKSIKHMDGSERMW